MRKGFLVAVEPCKLATTIPSAEAGFTQWHLNRETPKSYVQRASVRRKDVCNKLVPQQPAPHRRMHLCYKMHPRVTVPLGEAVEECNVSPTCISGTCMHF